MFYFRTSFIYTEALDSPSENNNQHVFEYIDLLI